MSRIKLAIIFSLAMVAVLGSGLVYAQEAEEEVMLSIGTATFSDDQALSDSISYMLMDVPAPADGTAYEGWLVSNNGKTVLSTGVMDVEEDGSVSHSFSSPDGENLLALYDKLVITVEPVPDTDSDPSSEAAYSSFIPQGAMGHVRHLIVSFPEGEPQGIVASLQMQLDEALVHAQAARAEADKGNLSGAKNLMEQVINIIEGEDGANFGDIDGDGQTSNPGDGVGVLGHASNLVHASYASAAAPGDEAIAAAAALVAKSGANVESWTTQARDVALNNVMNAATANLAGVFIGPGAMTVVSQLEAARNGFRNVDGAEQTYANAQMLATFTIVPGPLPEEPLVRPGLGLPGVGDTSVPMLAPMALLASLLFLSVGAALMVRRRSRSTS